LPRNTLEIVENALEIPRNTLEIVENVLEILRNYVTLYFIFCSCGSSVGGGSAAPVGVVRPPREPLPYVLPKLFDERTDTAHQSYHSAICEAELGTVRSRGPGHYSCREPARDPADAGAR
jgi:hypothetical protein